jgi:hypothetical protein
MMPFGLGAWLKWQNVCFTWHAHSLGFHVHHRKKKKKEPFARLFYLFSSLAPFAIL